MMRHRSSMCASTNLIFNVECDDEDEDDCVIESGDFRIAYDAVHRHEQEGRRQRAQDADRVPKGHQLFGGRGSHLFGFNRNKMVQRKMFFDVPTRSPQQVWRAFWKMKNPTLPKTVKASTLTILELKYLIAVFYSSD
jgi:hypothetical protein